MIKENLILFYNNLTSSSNEVVQKVIHYEPVESVVEKLSEISDKITHSEYDYHPLRYLDHISSRVSQIQPVETVTSILDSWMFWLGMALLVFLVGGLFYFDNPVKSCLKGSNTTPDAYVRTGEGEIIYQESLFRRWFINPIKSLFVKDKGKAVDRSFDSDVELGEIGVESTPVNTSTSSNWFSSSFSRLFKRLNSPSTTAPQNRPYSPESPLLHKNVNTDEFVIGSSLPSEVGDNSAVTSGKFKDSWFQGDTSEPLDKFGNAIKRRVPINMGDSSIDMITDIQYDFDWSTLQEPRKDLVKDYIQSYGSESFIDETQSVSTPSLVSDNETSSDIIVSGNIYDPSTDVFDNIW